MLDDKDINQIAQKVAQILSNEQPTKPTHAYQAELGRHGFVDGLGNHYNHPQRCALQANPSI